MKPKLFLIFFAIQLISPVAQSQQKSHVKSKDSVAWKKKVLFIDQSKSTLEVVKDCNDDGSNCGWMYTSTEIYYEVRLFDNESFGKFFVDVPFDKDDVDFFIVKTSVAIIASQGSENVDKTMTVEIRPSESPTHKPFIIKHNCDNIYWERSYYKTTKNGCCGGDDELAIYDFQNHLLVQGDVNILVTEIPNSTVRFYCSYKSNYNDSTLLGTVFFTYDNSDKYQIKIKTTPYLSSECEYRVPDIFIYSPDPKDEFKKGDYYQLWSLDNIKSKDQINNIILKLAFECNTETKLDTIEIPIINGKPFGKDDRIQEYSYKQK